MDKILISNIGNRNLKVNGLFVVKFFNSDEKASFRDETRYIWEQLQKNNFEEKLEPVILNEVIEKEKKNLKKVILITSDMPEQYRNDQDTVYAGKILCHIFKKQYPNIDFTDYPVQAQVYKHDDLFPEYRNLLSQLKKQYSDKKIIYCDAGGTSQQKFAMKIALEYMYEPEQFLVYYVAQEQKGQSKVIRGESYEYRKIIDMEHVVSAINSSAYQLALKILTNHNHSENDFKYQIVNFLDNRSRFLIKETNKSAEILRKKDECPEFIKDYTKKTSLGDYSNWKEILAQEDFFQLCEILAIVQWKFSLGIVEQAVHFFSMFIENYIYFTLKNKFNYSFDINYEIAYSELLKDYNNKKFNFSFQTDPNRRGLPSLIELTEHAEYENNKKIIEKIKNLNSFYLKNRVGIDTFRNNYAHKGLGVNIESLRKRGFLNEIADIFNLLGMDFNRNYYDEMHREICEIIRN